MRINNAIKNNYGKHQSLTLHLEIPMGTPKNFFEIHEIFGQATSKKFASPILTGLLNICMNKNKK